MISLSGCLSSCVVAVLAILAAPIYFAYFPARLYEVRGKCAIVTGASDGIGVHIAERLASEGVAKLIIAARREDKLQKVKEDITRKFPNTKTSFIKLDLNSKESREAFVKLMEADTGSCEILVNNAGMEKYTFAEAYSDETLDNILGLNLVNTIKFTRDVMPLMFKAGQGHVVNVASLAGKSGVPYNAAYSASKYGMLGYTHSLRAEMRLENKPITAHAVLPGFVRGDGMAASSARALGYDFADVERLVGASNPEEAADAVVQAILYDEPELLVNSLNLRPLLAINSFFPRTTDLFNKLSVDFGQDVHLKMWRAGAQKHSQ